jgi:serine phosphatase RsbU (regulator of sigma subunit)
MTRRSRDDAWFALSVLVLAVIAVADAITKESSLTAACAVAPILASATCSTRRTAIVSVLSLVVGGWLLLAYIQDTLSTVVRVAVLLVAAVLAPLVAHVRERHERRIRDLTRVARVAQDAVLTPVPSMIGAVRLASAYESAASEARIGGDLFGVVTTPGQVRLLVGDVKGKGLEAVRTAALTLAAFREAAHQQTNLTEVAAACHARLRPHLADEDFVTGVFAAIDDSGRTELVSYGHPPPLLLRDVGFTALEVGEPAGPLGLSLDPGSTRALKLQLTPGDRLLFFTDGLAEARDDDGNFVDVHQLIDGMETSDFDRALPDLLTRLHTAARSLDDDLALLLVEYLNPAGNGDRTHAHGREAAAADQV